MPEPDCAMMYNLINTHMKFSLSTSFRALKTSNVTILYRTTTLNMKTTTSLNNATIYGRVVISNVEYVRSTAATAKR